MKLSKLKINPNNPQKFNDLSKLENSIKEFPKMMQLRPLVYDPETMQVLGGNKRLICLQNLGHKEIPDTWMNAGIYHLQKEVLGELPTKGDIEKTLFPDYAKKGKLNTIKFKNTKWYSVDSFKDMEECSLEIEKIIK